MLSIVVCLFLSFELVVKGFQDFILIINALYYMWFLKGVTVMLSIGACLLSSFELVVKGFLNFIVIINALYYTSFLRKLLGFCLPAMTLMWFLQYIYCISMKSFFFFKSIKGKSGKRTPPPPQKKRVQPSPFKISDQVWCCAILKYRHNMFNN